MLSKKIWVLLSLPLLAWDCQPEHRPLPYYNTPDFSPIFVYSESEIEERVTHQIAPFAFTNQHGQTITQRQVEGKIHVANFFFTSCGGICPVMTTNMKKVERAFAQDAGVAMLSFSVTPWADSVGRLRQYAQSQQISNPNWHLLTGKKSEIYELARQSYFAEEDLGFTKDSTDFLHTEHFLLIDEALRIRGIYNGTLDLEIEQLIADIWLLKASK